MVEYLQRRDYPENRDWLVNCALGLSEGILHCSSAEVGKNIEFSGRHKKKTIGWLKVTVLEKNEGHIKGAFSYWVEVIFIVLQGFV